MLLIVAGLALTAAAAARVVILAFRGNSPHGRSRQVLYWRLRPFPRRVLLMLETLAASVVMTVGLTINALGMTSMVRAVCLSAIVAMVVLNVVAWAGAGTGRRQATRLSIESTEGTPA